MATHIGHECSSDGFVIHVRPTVCNTEEWYVEPYISIVSVCSATSSIVTMMSELVTIAEIS
jgi:hypothetical protein